jgi:hypothetical protein
VDIFCPLILNTSILTSEDFGTEYRITVTGLKGL